MRKERTLLFLGILVAVLPALGFPSVWKQIISIVVGTSVVYIAYLYYSQIKSRNKNDTQIKSFTDNTEQQSI